MNGYVEVLKPTHSRNQRVAQVIATFITLVALIIISTELASAEKVTRYTTSKTQNQFTRDCRNYGGTPKSEATKVVSCTWNETTKTTCDFNQKPAACKDVKTYEPAGSGADAGNLQVVDQTVAPADAVSGPEIESDSIIDSNPVQVAESEIVAEPTEQAEPTSPTEDTVSTMPPSDVDSLPEFGQ